MARKPVDLDAIKRDIILGTGYGKPPEHTRFQKGQSGNPLGRPAKQKPEPDMMIAGLGPNAAIARRVLLETVKVRTNGKLCEMPKMEAVMRNLERIAFKGGVQANRELMKLGYSEDARQAAALAADQAFWQDYIVRYPVARAKAAASGVSDTSFWINPEDITFHDNKLTTVRGPKSSEYVKDVLLIQRLLQALIAKHNYDIVMFPKHRVANQPIAIVIAFIWADFNSRLSTQMAKDNEAFWDRIQEFASSFFRQQLTVEVEAAWAALGTSAPLKQPMTAVSPALFNKLLKLLPAAKQMVKDMSVDRATPRRRITARSRAHTPKHRSDT